ncbi:alpha-2-macroglobulin family protein [Tropicibacter alexandrii]|uniref:alpha-2-macroglobulin family protein n=1 Tax=Tropicibacter alexandrii TaxID=2267683 RepID=UPI000EF4F7F2|nr:alpha-2-macroglobulin family protein [Tropicibacter alexandrii]
MRRFALGLFAALIGLSGPATVQAQTAIPDRRIVVTRDIDYYGSDLQALFDTSYGACERLCLNDPQCVAFTFNTRSNACFPKSGVSDRQAYNGAISGRVIETGEEAQARAALRRAEIRFLRDSDFAQARNEATALALRHAGGQYTVEALLTAAADAQTAGNRYDAINWTGAALAQTDAAEHWQQYADWSWDYAMVLKGSEQDKYVDRALHGAINAYLRADDDALRARALHRIALGLEENRRGREMIEPLRMAFDISNTAEIEEALDKAIGKYGFRITEHQVEADSAEPRICAQFSEALVRAGQDYAPYVRLPDPKLAVSADDSRICITGVQHGSRYTVTFRAGLPAASGEKLVKDVPITTYVRDRSPRISFPGRAYVLPRTPDAGIPIETVNLSEVDLTLSRLSDRNLIAAMRDQYFGEPLRYGDDEYIERTLGEKIWEGTGEVQNELNTDMLTRLPMGEALGDLPAGIYLLAAREPGERDYNNAQSSQWFILSDIGLTTMQGTDGLTVFARDLRTAGAMEGVEVQLYATANRLLGSAMTDAEGVARFAPGLLRGEDGSAPALVMAKQGDEDIAFLSLTDPAFDLSDRGVEGRAPAGAMDAFLATDRGVYRAGEVIHATTLLRDATAAAIPDVPLTAILTRPDGVEYSRHVSDGGQAGGHVFDLPVGDSAPRGTWRLAIHADPKAEPLTTRTLLVEDFVPERIDFDLTLPEGPINPLSPPDLTVAANYLYGAPGADLKIEGELRMSTATTLDGFPRYRFGRYDDQNDYRTNSFDAGLVTDADGNATLPLPIPELDALGRPMSARITLRLSEASGRPVEREITRPVAPPTPMIGIRPAFDGDLGEGAEARFDVIALGPDLQPRAMQVEWRLNRVNTRYQWYQRYGNWRWEPITTRETVARGEGTLGAEPLSVAGDVEWGRYELVVERTDGPYLAAATDFYAGWYAPVTAQDTPDMLEMSLDAVAYKPGDTATLRMVPRYAGKALVTVLADRVISMQAVDVAEGENTLQLPVTDDWGAGVYVTAQVIRPMDVAAGQNPARSLGLTHAAVDPGARKLAVSFDAPAESDPRSALRATVNIDAPDGQAFVTVAAVDVGILNLTGFKSPDPAAHYFGQRRLGVEIRDMYGRLIDGMNGAMGAVRSGGDGAASMRMQSPPPTEAIVAFFSGPVAVQDGKAKVEFQIPDFNGTVKLMAVAWSPTAVGAAETDVLVRDPVVISASMPRFLAPGDQSRLLLELTHAKGQAGEMPLSVTSDGMGIAQSQRVTLTEGGKTTLDIPLKADLVGDHVIQIALQTPSGQQLTKTLTLGVRANDPAVGATRRLSLAPGQTFTLDREVFAGLRLTGSEALISAGPLARFDAPGLLAALDRYPYGCTEQVTSKALPLLYMSSIAEPLGLGDTARMDQRIAQSIEQILTRQAPNGAFGLWGAYSGDTWLDAYVTDFLSRAKRAGHQVPDLAFQNALDNLKNRIAYASDFDDGGEDIAYALMVLAREGAAAMGDLRYYADERADNFGTPLAQAQLGAALASYGDQPRADKMFGKAAARIAATPTRPASLYRIDFGSTVRDAAGILSLAVEARSDAVNRDALVSRISAANRPLSTQEQSWALLAAHAMVQDPSVSGLEVDGQPLAGPFVRRIEGETLVPMTVKNTAATPTDITLTTLGIPDGATEAGGYGYALTRAYYTLDGEEITGDIKAGTRMVAVLTIKPADKTRARLIVDDALPAGFEIDNPSLLRAGDIKALDWLETMQAEHSEFRTDRFIAALDYGGTKPVRLAYMLRAVSPGTFHHPAALVEDMYRPDFRATTASGTVTVLP